MARETVAVENVSRSGLSPSRTAAIADGHQIANDGNVWLEVQNSGSEITLTIQTPGTVDGLAVADRTVTIPASTGDVRVGPFPPSKYNQSDGMIYVDYSSPTGVTIAPLTLSS